MSVTAGNAICCSPVCQKVTGEQQIALSAVTQLELRIGLFSDYYNTDVTVVSDTVSRIPTLHDV